MRLAAAAVGSDPERGLRAVCELRSDLDLVERMQVAYAYEEGWSWARIARALGVSRQAIHRKYSANPPKTPVRRVTPRLSGRAKLAMAFARSEAAAHGDALVGTEHLLTGLLLQGEGPAAEVLREVRVSVHPLRAKLAELTPSGISSASPQQLPFSRRARAALQRAIRGAARKGREEVEDEALLCALIEDRRSGAVYLLAALKVNAQAVRSACARRRSQATSSVDAIALTPSQTPGSASEEARVGI